MKNKYGRLIIALVSVIILLPAIIVFLVNNIRIRRNNEPIRYDFEIHTIEYIAAHLDDLEKMCEYDLQNYSDYERGESDAAEPEYRVPKSDDLFSEERKAIFQELGVRRI